MILTSYEWSIETVDEHGDIQDSDFSERLDCFKPSDLTYDPAAGEDRKELVLVRSLGSEDEGVISREWAYLKAGKLPKEFDGGWGVPKRFHQELTRWLR